MNKNIKLNQLLQEVIAEAVEKYKKPSLKEQKDPEYIEMKKAVFESLSKMMDEQRGRKPSPDFTGLNSRQYEDIDNSLTQLLKSKGNEISQNANAAGMLSEFGEKHFEQYITSQLSTFANPLLKAMIEFMYTYEKPKSQF